MGFSPLVLSTAVLTVTAAVALSGAASADAPTRETVRLTRQIPTFASCDGFLVKAAFDLVREITTFTDEAGVPVRRRVHATISGTVSNSVTGYSLPSTGVRNFEFDLAARESFSTGSNTVVHLLGGGGAIHLGTGRLQFDDTTGQVVGYSGPTDERDYQSLCAALA